MPEWIVQVEGRIRMRVKARTKRAAARHADKVLSVFYEEGAPVLLFLDPEKDGKGVSDLRAFPTEKQTDRGNVYVP